MFAFVIWDKEENELFAARDRFGIKPFYYCENNGQLYFASKKKSLLSVVSNKEVDAMALQHYFTFQYVTEPYTLNEAIQKLEPGHFIQKGPNQPIKIGKYWEPIFKPMARSIDEDMQRVQDVLRDSVMMHMRSDVPVGSFLSGGIDSNAVVALAKELYFKRLYTA
jgi:asparagine synthase (glutamine-hydrolysing)